MYQKVVFETAEEYFEACNPNGEIRLNVPDTVGVVFDGSMNPRLEGKGSEKFGLEDISQSDMIAAAFRRAGSSVHIT